MRIPNLITDRTARLPGDYAPQGSRDQGAPADAPAGQDGAGTAFWRGNVLTIVMPGAPIGKPRMTRRDKWTQRPAVLRYREWADRLREVAGAVPSASEVVDLSWTAYFEPPKSWSKKRREEAIGTKHRVKPDSSNILKGIEDILWPKGDSALADGSYAKRWDWEPRLEIRIEVSE